MLNMSALVNLGHATDMSSLRDACYTRLAIVAKCRGIERFDRVTVRKT